jgi:Mn2+/Fe2+ NRAMP family transporter
LLVAILAVNAITLVADLEAGAAALNLLAPAGWRWFVVPCAAVVVAMLVFGDYDLVNRSLRWVVLVFLVYVAAAFLAHPHWGTVALATARPHFSLNSDYVAGALALLGTSLTGYVYVWETIEEAEQDRPRSERRLAEWDAALGMAATAALFWFILVTTGATLGEHHKTVQTAQDAASALGPAAGSFARYLFAVGLLAASLLAIPVLAASSAYVIGDQFGWRTGLSRHVSDAKPFYATLIGVLAVAAAVALAGVSPIELLFAASIAGGIGTPIGIFFLLFSLRARSAPRDARAGWRLTACALATLSIVCLANLAFFGHLLWREL